MLFRPSFPLRAPLTYHRVLLPTGQTWAGIPRKVPCVLHSTLSTATALPMDVSRYAAKPEAYDALSAYQIATFLEKHGLARDETDSFAANLVGSPVSATPVQGGSSYTVSGDEVAQIVQFRGSQLPMRHIEVAQQLYGDLVPECTYRGMFGNVHVYTASLVPGPAFCRVRNQFFSPVPTMEQRLQQTVQDFARFDPTITVPLGCPSSWQRTRVDSLRQHGSTKQPIHSSRHPDY